MTTRTGGNPEPEFRLPAMIFPAIIGPMGVLIFGLVVGNGKSYWAAAVGFGCLGFGLTAGSNVVVTYAVDAYRAVRPLLLSTSSLESSLPTPHMVK